MRALTRSLLFSGVFALSALPASWADAASEAYVYKNANAALESLNDPDLTSDARRAAFNELMNRFTDLDRVSNFVAGKYWRRFSDEKLAEYRSAFRTYALATYEAELDQYRGNEIVVEGSVDRNERDSIVKTRVARNGFDLPVEWRVLKKGDEYTVVDVALKLEGNLIWLGIEQRAQFLDILDRNNGDPDALIAKIEEMTAKLNREAAERIAAQPVEVTSELPTEAEVETGNG